MVNPRGKGRGRGRGRGRQSEVAGRGRSPGQGDTVPASDGALERRRVPFSSFLSQFTVSRGTPLLDPQQCEQVINWIADNASSSLSTAQSSTQSTNASQGSGPQDLSAQPPPAQPGPSLEISDSNPAYSQELFSQPFLDSQSTAEQQPDQWVCPDAQNRELSQSVGDESGDLQIVCGEVSEDETRVSDSEVLVSAVIPRGEQADEWEEEEPVDDEVTDPSWVVRPSQESASEGEASVTSENVARGRRATRGRGRARVISSDRGSTSEPVWSRPRCSKVWSFFKESEEDRRTVLCNLCHTKLSRGATTSNLSTTSMRRHMSAKHPTHWNQGRSPPSGRTAAPSPVSHAGSASNSPAQEPGTSDSRHATTPAPSPSPPQSTNVSQRSVQLSLHETFERKRKYASTHPHAQALNVHVSKLLSLEMLPYRLVETEAFRNLMAVAAPRYSVPSRHYFSRCAVPALHQHVSQNINRALTNAVTEKVHLTTDTWTSAGGQGHYISLTAHWINLVEAGTESEPGSAHVLPTPRIAGPTSVTVSQDYYTSPPSSSSSSSSSTNTTCKFPSVDTPPSVGSCSRSRTAVGKRQQAVLKLLSLGDKRHTAQELLQGMTAQTDLWLAPLNLKAGMVVCDNGRNLVAALQLGRLTHVPCLAHVFNLVVQRFLKTYPNLSDLLTKVRRICAHFRKSTTDAATLRAVQRRLQLPAHRLLCDVPTRWNSTLHMLNRVYQQRRAIVDCQMTTSTRTGSQVSQLPQIYNEEWTWMSDICKVLSHFDESTLMVSGDDAIISVTIPLLCLLKKSLLSMKSEAHRLSQEMGEEELTESQNTSQSVSQSVTEEGEEEDEDEEEETVGETEEGTHSLFSVQRVWAEEEELEEEEEEEMESRPVAEGEFLRVGTLAHMADFMLGCLSRDPRVRKIFSTSDYWVFTLLDPRYKHNFSTLIPIEERSMRLHQYQLALVHKLKIAFPSDTASGRGRGSEGQQARERRGAGSLSSAGRGSISKAFASFMSPMQEYATNPQSRQSRGEIYRKMVKDYLGDHTNVLHDHSAPYNYWVSKLDTWPELALYALEVLACPAASVLSERVFSAAGGIITDKRTRLSTDSADRLTLIKMNKAWISTDFHSPPC